MIRPLLTTVFALACLLPALGAQEKAEVVTFKTRAPVAGEFQGALSKSSSKSSVHMMRDGEEAPVRDVEIASSTKRDATILESKDGKVTKVKLHWREIVRENNFGEAATGRRGGGRRGGESEGEPTPEATELNGKTLILDLSGATPTVTDEEGKDMGEGMTRLVTRMECADGVFTGWSPDVFAVLGKKEFTIGESIPVTRDAAAKILGANSGGMRMRAGRGGRRGGRGGDAQTNEDADAGYSATLIFKGKRNVLGSDCGLFEINVTEANERSDERMRSKSQTTMTGELLVGVDNGWVYKLELKGKSSSETSVSMEERSMETSNTGTMEMLQQVIFAQPKTAPAAN